MPRVRLASKTELLSVTMLHPQAARVMRLQNAQQRSIAASSQWNCEERQSGLQIDAPHLWKEHAGVPSASDDLLQRRLAAGEVLVLHERAPCAASWPVNTVPPCARAAVQLQLASPLPALHQHVAHALGHTDQELHRMAGMRQRRGQTSPPSGVGRCR